MTESPTATSWGSALCADWIFARVPDWPGPVSATHGLGADILDDQRFVHSDDDGVAGVEFIEVSSGINLEGVPRAEEIREALAVFANAA